MGGRFPGARDLDQYWGNLAKGVESITPLTPEDVRSAGVPDEVAQLPGYVAAAPVLDQVDQFDAEFFGFSARDAALTDPQHRLFLETTWEALEDAGYDPATYRGAIGLFGGCEQSTYLYQLYLNREALGYLDGMQLMITNDKDHLCTQASYRLDLRGPSVVVQTTCSTSLVAVSLACESLQAQRCDIALAGGVTVRVPQFAGYLYTPGSILSPDGHCRPFDAEAQGTVVGSGVGLVVLKRLDNALADGDNVRGVILGVGLNNDGSDKAGYTAPSFRGQADVIRAAQAMAGVAIELIGYVEAHGTGTILGDPIELSALVEAFREHTDRRGFCGIGSVKSNFGHLSCAAGVAGLIKTVLMFEHRAIPPTVHYRAPNPAIDFVSSPFYVATDLLPWRRNGAPRRAGVSSFGVGGTNAHLILEEASPQEAPRAQRAHQLLVLSARSGASLDTACRQLAAHLQAYPEIALPDAAFTLHVGRRAFRHRRALVVGADDRSGAIAALRDPEALEACVAGTLRPVVFMFPGQGSQYPGMAEALYRAEPVVRRAIDHCARVLKRHVGRDLRTLLFPPERRRKQAAAELMNTAWAQQALFTVEYALAALWRSWGIDPAAMIGHSVGEYVAATIAGVMRLDDALLLIARRGQLIAAMPRGAMIAVMADAARIADFVDEEVSLAAVNAPGLCVLSGPHHAIERLEAALAKRNIAARRLHTSHAFHSAMMDPMLAEFRDVVASVPLSVPARPFVSTLTGRWADAGVAAPSYWSDQLRHAVRFADALATLAADKSPIGKRPYFLEVGPGRALTTFAAQTLKNDAALGCATLAGADDPRPDTEATLAALGRMWANGIAVDWAGFHGSEPRKRVSLPTYAFERHSYWIGAPPQSGASHKPRDITDWFYAALWRAAPALPGAAALAACRILVFDDETGVGAALTARLTALSAQPILVRRGAAFERSGENEYRVNTSHADDFAALVAAVTASEPRLAGVIFCWGLAPHGGDFKQAGELALLAPTRLAHALSSAQTVRPLPMLLVARGTAKVDADDAIEPPRALGIGAARVIPQEHPGLRLAHLDIDTDAAVAGQILAEFAAGASEPAVALREGRRFVEACVPVPLPRTDTPLDLPDRPVVLVTGGLGHIGINLSERMFERIGARLVLIGRAALPPPSEWAARAADPQTPFAQRGLLKRLARMQGERDDVLVLCADLNDGAEVAAAVDAAIARFGGIDLVVHGAGRIDAAAFALVAETVPSVIEAQMAPKLTGLLHLIAALRGREPKRFILHSSISTVLGGLGLAAYAGVNAVLDAFALAGGESWLSIDWDAWDNAAESRMEQMATPIHPAEGQEAFLRLLGADVGARALVVVDDLEKRLRAWVHRGDSDTKKSGAGLHPRPNLSNPYEEPATETQRVLAEIWSEHLGVTPVGIFDRFLDLGGHSLLGVQVASEIRDRFQIEVPVIKLFQAPTISQLGAFVDQARTGEAVPPPTAPQPPRLPIVEASPLVPTAAAAHNPGDAAKASYRAFYDDITRRLKDAGTGDASFFLNYGYVGAEGEAAFAVPEGVFNPNSIRLVYELIGSTDLRGRKVLDVGCGRGGTVALLAERFQAEPLGVDLSPEAIAFCREAHRHPLVAFKVGDAENLPVEDQAFDAVTNVESSHTYPNLRAFFVQVRRALRPGGLFLYTDLLPVQRWAEVRVLLASLSFTVSDDRDITDNVLASCDSVSAARAGAFGGRDNMIDNFLAVPGSSVYVQMQSRAWEYRILRAQCAGVASIERRGAQLGH
jgi:phthiocerol/phenolphthiocerol synthesis type-I polyketide synthase E